MIFESKVRLLYSMISFFFSVAVVILFFEDILLIITKPLIIKSYSLRFIYTELTEAFETLLLFGFGSAILLIYPLILYQIWAFFAPSCYATERKQITSYLFSSIIIFFLAINLLFIFIIPEIWKFFMNYETQNLLYSIEHETRILPLLLSLFRIVFSFLIINQSQLVIYFAISKNIISWKNLKNNRRVFLILAILIGSLISVPEIWAQLVTICFLLLLIEILLFISALSNNYQVFLNKE